MLTDSLIALRSCFFLVQFSYKVTPCPFLLTETFPKVIFFGFDNYELTFTAHPQPESVPCCYFLRVQNTSQDNGCLVFQKGEANRGLELEYVFFLKYYYL